MLVRQLHLTDFRNHRSTRVELSDGLTVIVGENGQGKSNLIEAIGWLAGIGSFRGAPDDALIAVGADSAVIRAVVESDDGREQLVEAELPRIGRNRIQVNRQRLQRSRDLLGVIRVTVFSPDDLSLVKGGPALRRRWLDEALVGRHPRLDSLRSDLDRVLKQRNALLRSAGGRLDADAEFTLDVWDAKLAETGEALKQVRLDLLEAIQPHLGASYDSVASTEAEVGTEYVSSWNGPLTDALIEARRLDVRRGVSTVGPHRDEVELMIGGSPARTHASQGEQRSLALAMRLAVDAVVREAGWKPVLLLDDVFSELDPGRAAALLKALPSAQSLLTAASGLPPGAEPDRVLRVIGGTISEEP